MIYIYKGDKDIWLDHEVILKTNDRFDLTDNTIHNLSTDKQFDSIDANIINDIVSNSENDDDSVAHPSYYLQHPSGVECITVAEGFTFNIGQVVKYVWRAGLKHEVGKIDKDKTIEDLEKAKWYLNREIDRIRNEK